MKLLIVFLVILLCAYIGYGIASHYKYKRQFYEELILLLHSLDLDICFSKEKIIDILNSKKISSRPLKTLVNNFCKNAVNLNYDLLFQNVKLLDNEEKNVIFSFFSSLGRFDVQLQSKQIEQYTQKFSLNFNSSLDDEKKYAPLFFKLGILFGALLGLIFI